MMEYRKLWCCVLAATAAGVLLAQDVTPVAALKINQPKPVAEFIDRVVDCNHWRGESPYDPDRAKEIGAALSKLRCEQLESDEKTLLARYERDSSTADAIAAAHKIFL